MSTNITKHKNNLNPFIKFERIKNEIKLIEEDLNFYLNNKELFNEITKQDENIKFDTKYINTKNILYKSNLSIQDAFCELKKVKYIANYISDNGNYKLLKSIKEKFGIEFIQKAKDINILSLLNKSFQDNMNLKMIENIKSILGSSKINYVNDNNINYELYLTPDITKVKMFSQIVEIKKAILNIKSILGTYELVRII